MAPRGTFLRTKVGRRILLLFAVCAVVPIAVLGGISYVQVVQQLENQGARRVQQATRSAGMAILERLSFLHAELEVLAAELHAAPSRAAFLAPPSVQNMETRFEALAVERESDFLVPLVGDLEDIGPQRSTAELAHLRSGEPLLFVTNGPNGATVYMGLQMDPADTASGVLWAKVPTAYLWGVEDNASVFPPQMDMCVLVMDAIPLYCSSPLPESVIERIREDSTPLSGGSFTWQSDGSEFFAAEWSVFLRVVWGAPSWRVVVSDSRADILAPIALFRRTFLLVLLASILAVLFLSNVQIRRSLDPLLKLRDGTRRLAKRDFGDPVVIESGDEFEDLANSFNGMAETLRQQFDESDLLNAALMRTGERLRESEARLRTTLESAADGIVTTDVRGAIVSFNSTAEAMFGLPRDEIEGKSFGELMAEPKSDGGLQSPTDFQEVGTDSREVLGKRSDGTVFPMELAVTEMVLDGDRAFNCVLHDITQRKQAEEERRNLESQLRQAQKLETVGTLAGGIAHDFNNLLGPIYGYADLALVDVPEGSALREDLEEIRNAAVRAKDLVKQVLLMSRRGEQEMKPVQIGLIIREVLKLLRASFPSTIEIRHNITIDAPPIMADPTQIHQVFMNLCTNAGHAMGEEGGVLEVGLEVVDVFGETARSLPNLEPGRYVGMSVSDTGHGMDETTIERVFEPFFTTKEVGKGTGLGLAVSHGIIAEHGGDITVTSEVGKGTTFKFYLPMAEATLETDEEWDPLRNLGGNERVLLVDDDPEVGLVHKKILERLGYRVTQASDGLEAFEAFSGEPQGFDLMMTDRVMPRMSGSELIHSVRKLREDIPVILTTSFSGSLTEEVVDELGVCSVLMKPVGVRDLAEAVRQGLTDNGAEGG